jgi:hypothetical protein
VLKCALGNPSAFRCRMESTMRGDGRQGQFGLPYEDGDSTHSGTTMPPRWVRGR